MDNFLLEAATRELRSEAPGRRLGAVHQTPGGALLLVFDPPPDGGRTLAVVVDASAGRERLHRARRQVPLLRASGSPFVATLAHRLAGRRLEELRKDPAERVVELRFSGAGLVAELIPRAGRLILLDDSGRIVATDRPARGAAGRGAAASRLRTGEPWTPPASGAKALFEDPAAAVRAAAEASRTTGRPLGPVLRQTVRGLSEAVGREMERVAEAGGDPLRTLEPFLEAFRADRFSPVLYSSGTLADVPLDRVPREEQLFALPLALPVAPPGLTATRFDTASEAAEALYEIRLAASDFTARRDAVTALLRREAARLDRLAARLRDDLAGLPPPGTTRRQAEALLAGLSRARREGDRVLVPDPWSEDEAAQVAVPAPPGRPLQAVAADLFRREAKSERARVTVAERLSTALARGTAAGELAEDASTARDGNDLERIERRLREFGFVFLPDRKLRRGTQSSGRGGAGREAGAASGHDADAGAGSGARSSRGRRVSPGRDDAGSEPVRSGGAPQLAGVRRFVSGDGLEILVGRTGRDNDRLTFRIADTEDFWMHAAGTPGAHVVVRNPERLAHLPEKTLRHAAGLAAWFSRAAGPGEARPVGGDRVKGSTDRPGGRPDRRGGGTGAGGKVEVHVTRRKHVRKARGAPPGTVLLKKFTSLFVTPEAPEPEV